MSISHKSIDKFDIIPNKLFFFSIIYLKYFFLRLTDIENRLVVAKGERGREKDGLGV